MGVQGLAFSFVGVWVDPLLLGHEPRPKEAPGVPEQPQEMVPSLDLGLLVGGRVQAPPSLMWLPGGA